LESKFTMSKLGHNKTWVCQKNSTKIWAKVLVWVLAKLLTSNSFHAMPNYWACPHFGWAHFAAQPTTNQAMALVCLFQHAHVQTHRLHTTDAPMSCVRRSFTTHCTHSSHRRWHGTTPNCIQMRKQHPCFNIFGWSVRGFLEWWPSGMAVSLGMFWF
jgi:hypothetical protein